MGGHDVGRRLLAGLVSMTLLAGCGAGASPTPTTFGPVTMVTGTETCPDIIPDWTTDPDGHKHVRGQPANCTDKTDDPRVSGTYTTTWNSDLWGDADQGPFSLVQWVTARLENTEGAWEGTGSGVASSDRGDIMVFWYKGTGGYEGLSYFELITGSEPWKIQGQVFPGNPPPPYAEGTTITRLPAEGPVADDAVAVVSGTATCPTGDFGTPTTDADGVHHYRDMLWKCKVRTDDPRVTGTEIAPWKQDLWGTFEKGTRMPVSGASVQWGTARLENDGGAWEGTGSGVWSSDRGDILAIWYKGTGVYEGLSYFELWTGRYEPWRIQGQIFPGDPPTP